MRVRSLAAPLSTCLFVALLLALAGCSLFKDNVRELGRAATQGVGEELPNLKGPLKQTLREALLGDDLLGQAAQQLTSGTLHNLEAELQKGTLQKAIDDMLAHALATLGARGTAATRQLIQSAGPELQSALRQIVLATVASAGGALRESLRSDLTAATQLLARETAEALVAALVKALDGELGQKLKQTAGGLSQQLIQEATQELRAPASQQAVSEFTQSALKGAVRGTRDGLSESLPSRQQVALICGLIVCATLLMLLSGGFALVYFRYRKSTKTLTIIAEKINEAAATDLKQAIHKSATVNYVGPWLSSFLKERGL